MFENKTIKRIKEVITEMKTTIDAVEEKMRNLDNIEKINNKLNTIDKRISKIENRSDASIDSNTVKRLENTVSKAKEKPRENVDVVSAVRQELLKNKNGEAKVRAKNGPDHKYCYISMTGVAIDKAKYRAFVSGNDLVLKKTTKHLKRKRHGYVTPKIHNSTVSVCVYQANIVDRIVNGNYRVELGDDEIRIGCVK